jgi:hypothetical protein
MSRQELQKDKIKYLKRLVRIITRAIIDHRITGCEWHQIAAKKPIEFEVKITFLARE